MSLIIVDNNLTKDNIKMSREDYPEYIKITADIGQKIVVIGGEYHADAEEILVNMFSSKSSDVWGGGYNIDTKSFEVNAMLNLKPLVNDSLDILDPTTRNKFLEVVKNKLKGIESFT